MSRPFGAGTIRKPKAPTSREGTDPIVAEAMSEGGASLSGYKGVWLFAMFDLPVKTPPDRRNYTRFRKALLKEGFCKLQFSVYARYFGSEEASCVHRRRISGQLPPEGYVRLLTVTDRQFAKMENFHGKKKEDTEDPPEQLLLF